MSDFTQAFDRLIGIEGKYSDNPADSGGPTKYGITERVARANGYIGDMRDLSVEEARVIAKTQYWDVMKLDFIANLSYDVAYELFDTGYNMGVHNSGMFLQESLNALNKQETIYKDMVVDGIVGQVTLSAIESYLSYRKAQGELVLLRCLNGLQTCFYLDLVKKRQKDEAFLYGWILQRIV